MTALDRAEQDLERGEHWLALQRLASYISSTGYDPQVLERIGRIAYEMHDSYTAGRWWLASTAGGEEVERAIQTFITHAGRDPRQVAWQVPAAVRLCPLDAYPDSVQDRLRQLGLDKSITTAAHAVPQHGSGSRRTSRVVTGIVGVAFCIVLLFCVTSCCVGATRIISWIFNGD